MGWPMCLPFEEGKFSSFGPFGGVSEPYSGVTWFSQSFTLTWRLSTCVAALGQKTIARCVKQIELQQIEGRFDQSKPFDSAVPSRVPDQKSSLCVPFNPTSLPSCQSPQVPARLMYPPVFYAGDRLFDVQFLLEPLQPGWKPSLGGAERNHLSWRF